MQFRFTLMTLAIIAAAVSAGLSQAAVNSSPGTSTAAPKSAAQSRPATNTGRATPTKPTSRWTYSQDKDQMRGTVTHIARLRSENVLQLGFPYGESHAVLFVNDKGGESNIGLGIESGQFFCNFSYSTITAKFDDGDIETYGCTEDGNGNTNVIFIVRWNNRTTSEFLDKLKQSRRLIIEAPFFQAGRMQLSFQSQGLKWEYDLSAEDAALAPKPLSPKTPDAPQTQETPSSVGAPPGNVASLPPPPALPLPSPPTPPTATTSHAVTVDDYPPVSIRLQEQGNVGIKYLVKEDGTVGECSVTMSSGKARLDDAACTMAQRRWKFKPAIQAGRPVAEYLAATVAFRLN